MKPSHLAAFILAGLGVGGMSSAAMAQPIPSHVSASAAKQAPLPINIRQSTLIRLMSGPSTGSPPFSWHKKNQRQIRLARRRRHAAGDKTAFRG